MTKVIAPTLTNETLQQRLLTGASIKGGARGSLTRVATKYTALTRKLQTSSAKEDAPEEIQALQDELKREVKLVQVELNKWHTMIQSAKKELQDVTTLQHQMAANVEKKQQTVQALRDKAVQVAKTRKCWHEYEKLATLARNRPPRRVLQAKLKQATDDLETAKNQLYETEAESKIRSKQFHLLFQCMLDLKRSLGEAVEVPPQQKKEQEAESDSIKEEEEEEKAEAGAEEEEDGEAQPMETEPTDDGDGLYDGLEL